MLTCLSVTSIGAPLSAQNLRVITRDAEVEAEELIALTEGSITVRTERGSVETLDREQCIAFLNLAAIRQPRATSVYAPLGVLVLTDGQRLPGSPMVGPDSTPGVLAWRHRFITGIAAPLEEIAWAGIRTTIAPPEGGETDAVFLNNGDRIEGFIATIGDPVEVEQDGRRVHIELDQVESIRLIAPPARPANSVVRVWFDDGSVVDVATLALQEDGHLHFVPQLIAAEDVDVAMQPGRMLAAVFDVEAMIPLAEIPAIDVEGPLSRYSVPPPEIDAAARAAGLRDVTLRGPLVVRYAMPEGAMRLLGEAGLSGGAEEWADCEVVISAAGREVWRERLTGGRPEVRFDVPVETGELAIEITEGGMGPIGDHIVIRGGMIILDRGD